MLSKAAKAVKNPSLAYKHIECILIQRWYLLNYDYTEAYRRMMAYRLDRFGPEQAVGGFDNNIGLLQFEFLKEHGLEPHHDLLDVGCGTLRGGEHYIKYLEEGDYVGMDISEEALQAGIDRLESLINAKNPTLLVNDDLQFDDDRLNGPFEFAIAQSVFTHLPLEQIDECLANIGKVVDGMFYATFFDRKMSSPKDFGYKHETLTDLASNHGHSASVLPKDEYPHPKGQRMLEIDINE